MEICETVSQAKSFIKTEAASKGESIPDGSMICRDRSVNKWVIFTGQAEYDELNDHDLITWCIWENGQWIYNLSGDYN